MAGADRRRHRPAGAEAGVQAAVRIVADEGEVHVASIMAVPGYHDLAVGLQGDAMPLIGGRADRRRYRPAGAEAGVQAAVRIVADEGEIIVGSIIAITGHHDLAVGLQDDVATLIDARAERRRHLAAGAEGSVQGAVRVVANEGEIIVGSIIAEPGHHELAVGLQGDAIPGIFVARAEVRRHRAVEGVGAHYRRVVGDGDGGGIDGGVPEAQGLDTIKGVGAFVVVCEVDVAHLVAAANRRHLVIGLGAPIPGGVGAEAAVDCVVAFAALEDVGAGVAGQGVAVLRSLDVLDADQGIGAAGAVARRAGADGAARKVNRHRSRGVVVEDPVALGAVGAAVDGIVAGTAFDIVVAQAAVQEIVAGVADNDVVARPAGDGFAGVGAGHAHVGRLGGSVEGGGDVIRFGHPVLVELAQLVERRTRHVIQDGGGIFDTGGPLLEREDQVGADDLGADDIELGADLEQVVAPAGGDGVVAGGDDEGVVAGAADQRVIDAVDAGDGERFTGDGDRHRRRVRAALPIVDGVGEGHVLDIALGERIEGGRGREDHVAGAVQGDGAVGLVAGRHGDVGDGQRIAVGVGVVGEQVGGDDDQRRAFVGGYGKGHIGGRNEQAAPRIEAVEVGCDVARGAIVKVSDTQIGLAVDLEGLPVHGAVGGNGLDLGELAAIPLVDHRIDTVRAAIVMVGHRQVGLAVDLEALPVLGAAGRNGLDLGELAAIPLVDHRISIVRAAIGIVGHRQVGLAVDLEALPIIGVAGRNGLDLGELAAIPLVDHRIDTVRAAIVMVGHRQVGLAVDLEALPVLGAAGRNGLDLGELAAIPLVDHRIDVPRAAIV